MFPVVPRHTLASNIKDPLRIERHKRLVWALKRLISLSDIFFEALCMFCGNIFTSTELQNHKKKHMKKSQKRFHRVNRALFLSLSNAFEEQKFIPKISQKIFWSAPCFSKIVCGGQCAGEVKSRDAIV